MNLSLGRTASKQEIETLTVSLKAPKGKLNRYFSQGLQLPTWGRLWQQKGVKALENWLERDKPCGPGARGLPSVAGEVHFGTKGECFRQDQSAIGRLPGVAAHLGWGQQGSSQLPAQFLGRRAKELPSSEPREGAETSRCPLNPRLFCDSQCWPDLPRELLPLGFAETCGTISAQLKDPPSAAPGLFWTQGLRMPEQKDTL